MTYDLTNERVLTENLQRMLRYLSFAWNDERLRVNVNGEFDERTGNAVRNYQEISGLPVTEVVDLNTWNRIRDDYDRESERRTPVFIIPTSGDGDYFTRIGERSDNVIILQVILGALRLYYDYPHVPVSGVYGPQTAEAIRLFQVANGLSDTGATDIITWKRLAEEYNALPNQ